MPGLVGLGESSQIRKISTNQAVSWLCNTYKRWRARLKTPFIHVQCNTSPRKVGEYMKFVCLDLLLKLRKTLTSNRIRWDTTRKNYKRNSCRNRWKTWLESQVCTTWEGREKEECRNTGLNDWAVRRYYIFEERFTIPRRGCVYQRKQLHSQSLLSTYTVPRWTTSIQNFLVTGRTHRWFVSRSIHLRTWQATSPSGYERNINYRTDRGYDSTLLMQNASHHILKIFRSGSL